MESRPVCRLQRLRCDDLFFSVPSKLWFITHHIIRRRTATIFDKERLVQRTTKTKAIRGYRHRCRNAGIEGGGRSVCYWMSVGTPLITALSKLMSASIPALVHCFKRCWDDTQPTVPWSLNQDASTPSHPPFTFPTARWNNKDKSCIWHVILSS
jgi:hypothetical protein